MAIYVYPSNQSDNIPGISVTINTDSFTGSSSNSEKPLMIIGEADDGIPQTVRTFSSYTQAKQELRGGELLKALELAWQPDSNGTYYAGNIMAMRSQPATQAHLKEGTLTFTSKLYSEKANNILVSLQPNRINNTQRLVISFPEDGVTNTYDNLGNIFSLSYTGNERYASYKIETDENGFASLLTLSAGDSVSTAEPIQKFLLGDKSLYSKTNSLINAINQVAGFTATRFSEGNKNVYTKYYHSVDETQLTATPNKQYVYAIEGDILNTVGDYDSYVSIGYVPEGTPEAPTNIKETPISNGIHITLDKMAVTTPVDNFETTALSGASVGVSPDSWTDLFTQFTDSYDNNGYLGYYLIPLTDDAAIQAEATSFANIQTRVGNAMRVIVGAGISESKQQLISRSLELDDARANLVGNSAMVKMSDGTTQDMPGYMLAAMVGGLASGIDIGDSVTNKPLNLVSLDQNFTTDDINELTGSGVVIIKYLQNRASSSFRIVDDVTTSTKVDEPLEHEMAIGESSDFLVAGIREKLDPFIGSKINTAYASTLSSYVLEYLSDVKTEGIIMDYDSSSVSVTIVGSTANINATVYPDRTLKKMDISLQYNTKTLTSSNKSIA